MKRTRRALLQAVGAALVGGLAGCASDRSTAPATSRDATATMTTNGSTATMTTNGSTAATTGTGTPTETPVFENLSTDGVPVLCPHPDKVLYHPTPVPLPSPPETLDRETAVAVAVNYERAYLTNWSFDVLTSYPSPTPNTAGTPTPYDPEFPDVAAHYERKRVLDETQSGFVVQLQYTRTVDGSGDGRYTVNYYITPTTVVRAETEGFVSPGPHPSEDGKILSCKS